MTKTLRATHEGKLPIGNKKLSVAVLEDGTRLITYSAVFTAFGRTKRGRKKDEIRVLNVPAFIDANNLQRFISDNLKEVLTPITYLTTKGKESKGYKAEILPLLCDVYLDARIAKNSDGSPVLTSHQIPLATSAEILTRALSKVGIIALIDEATGFQEIRDRLALQQILEKYLLKEYAKWAKRFPDEFYIEMFRLKGWQWKGMSVNRPSVVGRYTNDIVYERLAPGVLTELKRLNPKDEKGNRKARFQQFLTPDTGVPALDRHLYSIIALMKVASNWRQFESMIARAFPKLGQTIPMNFDEK